MSLSTKKILKNLEKDLDSKRYEHTMGVAYTAAALAMVYDVDIEMARIAGLLHDCAKCIDDVKKINICEKNGISINDVERENPGLLHAKLGAYLAKTKYEVDDEQIINAIESHTTGKPAMSMLEKIIFVADYIEPNRKPLPNITMIRKLAFKNIDLAVYQILNDTLLYLKNNAKCIDPMTKKTLDYYGKGID